MSDILNCNTPVIRPKTPKEIENDITVLEKKNDYHRANIFKWFLLGTAITIITSITIRFLWLFFTNSYVQKFIIDQIMNNIVFIGLSVLAILKISLPDTNKWT